MLRALIGLASLALRVSAGTTAEGKAFLAENSLKEGVQVLASGLQYRVLSSGDMANEPPKASDPCTVHYTGTLMDGTVFDSSRNRGSPATFAPNGVVRGWTEALQMMRGGDRWELFIPSELAYGNRQSGPIPAGAVLIFDLELIKVAHGGSTGFFSMVTAALPSWLTMPVALGLAGLAYFLYQKFVSSGGAAVSASHILVKEKDACERLRSELAPLKGDKLADKFKELATIHSTCPSGKSGGGALGTFGRGQMVPSTIV